MRLSRLELFGFKSFLNRTVFNFNEGVTSIVGPNGCGKSNVVDAIIWALGERGTKSLRIKDMGDVIFHGSNGKRPVNIAEVAIEFQNGDGVDTAIKRRIYRDGANELPALPIFATASSRCIAASFSACTKWDWRPTGPREVRQDHRRSDGQVPPPRRLSHLRFVGAHGPAILHALHAGGRAGKLRLGGWRPARRHAVHRGAPFAHCHGAARGHRQGDGRFPPQLRR